MEKARILNAALRLAYSLKAVALALSLSGPQAMAAASATSGASSATSADAKARLNQLCARIGGAQPDALSDDPGVQAPEACVTFSRAASPAELSQDLKAELRGRELPGVDMKGKKLTKVCQEVVNQGGDLADIRALIKALHRDYSKTVDQLLDKASAKLDEAYRKSDSPRSSQIQVRDEVAATSRWIKKSVDVADDADLTLEKATLTERADRGKSLCARQAAARIRIVRDFELDSPKGPASPEDIAAAAMASGRLAAGAAK